MSPQLREPRPMEVEVVVENVVVRQGSLRQCLATEDRLRDLDWALMEEHRANREAKRAFEDTAKREL